MSAVIMSCNVQPGTDLWRLEKQDCIGIWYADADASDIKAVILAYVKEASVSKGSGFIVEKLVIDKSKSYRAKNVLTGELVILNSAIVSRFL